MPALRFRAVLEDFQERAHPQFFDADSSQSFRLRFANGPAIDRAQEKIQETLPCCSVVEYVANEGSFSCFLNEIFEPRGRRVESFEKKRKHSRVARGKLCRMQVPTLIVCGHERMLDVPVVKTPRAMNSFAVLFLLRAREPLAFFRAMR